MQDQKPLQDARVQKDILCETIGNFGKWQFRISLLMALLKFPIAWFQLGIVFLAPPTQFWCKPPDEYRNMTSDTWFDEHNSINSNTNHSHIQNSCYMRDVINGTNSSIPCIYGYEYNRTVFKSSIITEWDLVCDRARLVDVSQITLMLGVLIGNIVFGVAADRVGRKKVLMICILFQSLLAIIAAFSPWYWFFVTFRFLLAIANGGTMITSFVMCMEVVGGIWRTVVPILYQIPFGIGNSIMGGLAYFFRDWRHLQLVLAGISALYVIYIWFIPESPRWLMAVGKRKEALEVLQKAAASNGLDPAIVKPALGQFSAVDTKGKPKLSELFTKKVLRIRSILLCLIWLLTGVTFYAFSQYLGQVGRNIFLTVGLSGLIAIPGTLFCVFVVGRCGRRWTIACAHILTAICFLGILCVPKGMFAQDWPRVSFAGAGIIGMSISMPALYLFTGELYPTVVRNAGVGGAVMFSRIGSMLAPLVAALHDLAPSLPLIVLAILGVLEALLVLPLPETLGNTLPEKIEDLESPPLKENDIKNGNYLPVPTKTESEENDNT